MVATHWAPFGVALGAGLVHAWAIAWPVNLGLARGQTLWWLQLLALALLVRALTHCQNVRSAALLGWAFATAWLSASFWWLFVAMHIYGGLAAPLAVLAVLALAAALGGYYALACGLVRWLQAQQPAAPVLAFAALWTAAELARGTWLTGFGWSGSAYAHVDGPLATLAPWIGAYGMALVAAALAASLARPLQARRPALGAVTALAALALLRPVAPGWTHDAGSLTVALLQGAIPQDEKFEPGSGVPAALYWYRKTLLQSTASLTVAPETAIPVLPRQLPEDYWEALQHRFIRGTQAALIGIPMGNTREGYTNSVLGLQAGQSADWRYDKHHLVPFGEFIPPLFRWFTDLMHIPLGDFNRGSLGQPPFVWSGQRLAAHICYEDLFGEELAVRFARDATAPTVFVNLSNIAWFGDTVAIEQHLNIARLRALELERPFLRATNTGATVILDHQARVVAALPPQTRDILHGTVQGRNGTTPYAWWTARCGLLPLWLLVLAVLWWQVRRRGRG